MLLQLYSELARNKTLKTWASRVIAIFEFYSTHSIIFFQDKISVERVKSSKMFTLLLTLLTLQVHLGVLHKLLVCQGSNICLK